MDTTGTIKDPNGNTLQRNESYNYDQVARLTQASGFYAQRNYTYDRWGNRTGVSGGSSQTISYARDANNVPLTNRISSVNSGLSYTYDAAGDVTYDGGHSYGYDAESRMVTVDSGSTATNFYDAANRRVKKVAGGYTTYYVWEGSNVIAEYGNAPVGSGGTRFYHPDRLSNRMITDGSGVVKGTMDNLPFGEDGGVIGESEKHRFTTYERDGETGSDYAMNRQYSQSTARFGRTDPLSGSQGPQSHNRYPYVSNDPINAVDPLGLLVCFLTYESVTVPATIDGEDGWAIISIAHQFCFGGWGEGGGGGQTLVGGDPGGGGKTSRPPSPAQPKRDFWRCYNKWKFSKLFEDTPLHGAVEFLEVGLPDWSPHVPSPAGVSLAGDAVAIGVKATRAGVGGPKQAYASGLNWVFRRIFSGPTLRAAIGIGSKATPALAVTGVFTGSYNATIAAQCLAGILE